MRDAGMGTIGSGSVVDIHAEVFNRVSVARVAAVASLKVGKAQAFAQRHGIADAFTDYRHLLEVVEVDIQGQPGLSSDRA